MREPQETQIGDHHYRVTPLMATKGLEFCVDVIQLVGPSAGVLIDGFGVDTIVRMIQAASGDDKKTEGESQFEDLFSKFGDGQVTDKFVEHAVRSLLSGLTKDKAKHIVRELAGATKIRISRNGELTDWMALAGETFELHFQGQMGELTKWAMWAIKVQVSNFSPASNSAAL